MTPLNTIHLREDTRGSHLAPSFGDLSRSEKFSEIKPPLMDTNRTYLNMI